MKLGPFALDVMKGADLKVPGIAHKTELEDVLEMLGRQHLLGGNDLGMPRKLGTDSMTGPVTESVRNPHQVVVRVAPAQRIQGRTHTGPAGLGDVHKEKLIAIG